MYCKIFYCQCSNYQVMFCRIQTNCGRLLLNENSKLNMNTIFNICKFIAFKINKKSTSKTITFTFEPLPYKAKQHFSTKITECRRFVRVNCQSMRHNLYILRWVFTQKFIKYKLYKIHADQFDITNKLKTCILD